MISARFIGNTELQRVLALAWWRPGAQTPFSARVVRVQVTAREVKAVLTDGAEHSLPLQVQVTDGRAVLRVGDDEVVRLPEEVAGGSAQAARLADDGLRVLCGGPGLRSAA